jgi:hypothetical protein
MSAVYLSVWFWISLLGALQVVVGDDLVLVGLLERLKGVAPGVADADLAFLGHLGGALRQLEAAFAGEGGDGAAQEVALRHRVDADVGALDRLADVVHRGLVERLHHDRLRVRGRDGGHVLQTLRDAIGLDVDLDVLDHLGVGLAGVQRAELAEGVLDGLGHLVGAVGDGLLDVHEGGEGGWWVVRKVRRRGCRCAARGRPSSRPLCPTSRRR